LTALENGLVPLALANAQHIILEKLSRVQEPTWCRRIIWPTSRDSPSLVLGRCNQVKPRGWNLMRRGAFVWHARGHAAY
jgi:hypothetical protein